jgi:hypothetical protein
MCAQKKVLGRSVGLLGGLDHPRLRYLTPEGPPRPSTLISSRFSKGLRFASSAAVSETAAPMVQCSLVCSFGPKSQGKYSICGMGFRYIHRMWFEMRQRCELLRDDETQHVVPWRVNIKAWSEDDAGMASYTVGRILADEIRPFEAREWGKSPWAVADSDSAGLEAAYCALLDQQGRFREDEFEAIGEPVVYMWRFELHPDFAMCRLTVLDCFCRRFLDGALILLQYHATWLSLAEFDLIGFRALAPSTFKPPEGAAEIDETTRFMVRDNAAQTPYKLSDYPDRVPNATREHAKWVKAQGPW